jgi:hypothetical protein
MCDIYSAECRGKDCDLEIDFHIGDFSCDREDVKVWCENCLEQMPRDNSVRWAVVEMPEDPAFAWKKDVKFDDEKDIIEIRKVGIRVSDPNGYSVRPNIGGRIEILEASNEEEAGRMLCSKFSL